MFKNFVVNLNSVDIMTLGILLILVLGLMFAIYMLFVNHNSSNRKTTYSNLNEVPKYEMNNVVETPIEEENVVEETIETEVEEASVEETEEQAVAEASKELVEEISSIEELNDSLEPEDVLVEHVLVEATCTEKGTVSYFESESTHKFYKDQNKEEELFDLDIPALGHELVHHEKVDATCTKDGNIEFYECTRCNKLFSDKECLNEVSEVVVKAEGHNVIKHDLVEATPESFGCLEYFECLNCKQIFKDVDLIEKVELDSLVIPKIEIDEEQVVEIVQDINEDKEEIAILEETTSFENEKNIINSDAKDSDIVSNEVEEVIENTDENLFQVIDDKSDKKANHDDAIAEVVEKVVETATIESTLVSHHMEELIQESTNVEEAHKAIADEVLSELVEVGKTPRKYLTAKKEKHIINIDVISNHFNNGDEVNLDTLKSKNLLPKKCNYFKVLARGVLNKAITVTANDFSNDAIKMILVTGGRVIKLED